MHYIPFENEDPKNTYENFDCRNCPCFVGQKIFDYAILGTCKYNGGNKEKFRFKDYDPEYFTVRLRAGLTRNCPIQYKDPVENFHYYQFMSILHNDLVNTVRERYDKYDSGTLTDEEEKGLHNRYLKIIETIKSIEQLYPDKKTLHDRLVNGNCKLDENMKPYKIGE